MEELFSEVLRMSFQGGIVILVVLALRLVLKKAPKRSICLLWLLAGLRLLVPVQIESPVSLQPDYEPVTYQEWVHEGPDPDYDYAQSRGEILNESGEVLVTRPLSPDGYTQGRGEILNENGEVLVTKPLYSGDSAQGTGEVNWESLIPYIWLAGVAAMGLYTAISYGKLKKKVADAVILEEGVWMAGAIDSPFLLGFLHPQIYLPLGLTEQECAYVLAHERVHLKRKDHWWKLLGFVALSVYWFNPLVWLGYALLCRDLEMACDEAVVKTMDLKARKAYSAALVSCSARHLRFAACPVAFGEVSVKERVKFVLKFKKPGFWITMLAVIAAVCVAVFFLTSPGEKTGQAEENVPSPTQSQEETALWKENADLRQICDDAIEQLIRENSLFVRYEAELFGEPLVMEYRKHGNDELVVTLSDPVLHSRVFFEGQHALFLGDDWVWQDSYSGEDIEEWLLHWSPQANESSQFRMDENKITFDAVWDDPTNPAQYYEGTLTFIFRDDGSLERIEREYVLMSEGEILDSKANRFIPVAEQPEDTYRAIQTVAEQCITEEELEQNRLNRGSVSDIPSNKTSYDMQYELGSSEMGWMFFANEIMTKFGATKATATSAVITHSFVSEKLESLVAEDSYWLETFVAGKWQFVNDYLRAVPVNQDSIRGDNSSYRVDWSDTYGSLEPGFYRVGRYYTATNASGEKETCVCYAKFRLVDETWETLLSKCEEALRKLIDRESYHLVCYNYLAEHADPEEADYLPYTITTEVWSDGEDYLEDVQYIDRQDKTLLHDRKGTLVCDGVGYELQWENPQLTWRENQELISSTKGLLWVYYFDWITANIVDVVEKNWQISVCMQTDSMEGTAVSIEMVYTFGGNGNLIGMSRILNNVPDTVLEVKDTSAQQIRTLIEMQKEQLK